MCWKCYLFQAFHKPDNYFTPVLLAQIINLIILAKVSELCRKEAKGLHCCRKSHLHSSKMSCQTEVIQSVIELQFREGAWSLN